MSQDSEDSDRSFDPTPQKLQKAREKGEVAKSQDLAAAAAYAGLLVAALVSGVFVVEGSGVALMVTLSEADRLAPQIFDAPQMPALKGLALNLSLSIAPLFLFPIALMILVVFAQNAWVFSTQKLAPKLSRVSPLSNAKHKFGRAGLFEFFKSFVKLCLYSVCLGAFLSAHRDTIFGSLHREPAIVTRVMVELCLDFLLVVTVVAIAIGAVDWLWQRAEHLRQNRMTRKELTDETKEAEGDPFMKQARRQRGMSIAANQMMAEVPKADVVIVNPTHYAVALSWSRLPGSAPVCVAKGVDHVAAAIRQAAIDAGVPLHSDPPTARALHASVELGAEIAEEHYRAVAAAIRFAEDMRRRAARGVS